jgi:protein-S-isoprenylcysteine O-methyltransferase Ste14
MPAASTVALQASNLTAIGIGIIIGLLVLGVLISLVITAIVGRIIVAVVVIAAAVLVWQQRTSIQHKFDRAVEQRKCELSASFFGLRIDAPDRLRQACRARS